MEPVTSDDYEVLYLDNHLLVVNKAAGLLSQADATGDPDLLTLGKALLKARFHKPGQVFLGLVHRLDRPASGVMVLARTSKAAARLSAQFRARTPTKRYCALVEGAVIGEGTCEDYLLKAKPRVRVVSRTTPGAQHARLAWKAVAQVAKRTLLEVTLETGRPHQIRVQLSSRGMPIVGDLRYGARQELDGRNLALHCYALTVEHPTRRESMTWTALPGTSWGEAWQRPLQKLAAAAHTAR